MKRILIPIIASLLCLQVHAENIPIQENQLPEKSREIIVKAFPDKTIKKAYIDRRASLVQYEVKISGGIKMQFSKNGSLTECTCDKSAVPDVLVPAKIRAVVESEFPKNEIRSIEHDSKLFEIVLDNGNELTFNRTYRLISIDYYEKDPE